MIETIKEYLVSLGFKTDNSSLNTAQAAMGKAEDSVTSFANSSVKSFAKAAVGVVTFVATANLALGKFIVSLAQADLQTEMFAQKMWMSKDAAKAYQSSLDALGVSINDLYLSPELMNKYLDLNRQARDMGVPAEEYEKQMRGVRDITFQFQRLKLEGTYALQWIGYYLTKYLAGPLGDIKEWLTKVNDEVQRTMPIWTKRVTEVASWFVRLGKAAWSIRDALGAVVGVLAGFKMISMLTNPLGLLILGMTALLLLVDDFNTYKDGGESAFPKLWEWVEKFKKSLEDNGYIKDFKDILKDVVQGVREFGSWLEKIGDSKTFQNLVKDIKSVVFKLGEILESTGGWFADFFKTIKDNGDLEEFGTDIANLVDSFLQLVTAVGDLMLKVGKGGIGDSIKHNLINVLEIVDGLVQSIAGGLQIITGLLSGNNSIIDKGVIGVIEGAASSVQGPVEGKKTVEGWRKGLKEFVDKKSADGIDGPLEKGSTGSSQGGTSPWESFKKSIPGANTDASTVDWSALKKGFVSFMNSIPQELGNISEGLFKQTSAVSGAGGANHMSYLYPQTNTSNMSQVSMKQTYHIYGASNPEATATTVNRTSTAAFTRHFQGSVR